MKAINTESASFCLEGLAKSRRRMSTAELHVGKGDDIGGNSRVLSGRTMATFLLIRERR